MQELAQNIDKIYKIMQWNESVMKIKEYMNKRIDWTVLGNLLYVTASGVMLLVKETITNGS